MDKIQLLQERKTAVLAAGKELRDQIKALIDADSFVELSTFSFSKNDFYGQEIAGEGVVTGFATIDGYPFYVVGQNFAEMQGGVSKANCDKIAKCLDAAKKNATPVVYLLNTHGVQVGEGVTVLEGLADVFMKSTRLKGEVLQYAIVNGDVYGSAAMLAAIADFAFFVKGKGVLAINSPFVLSAKAGKNLPKENVGGYAALTNIGVNAMEVDDLADAKAKILDLSSIFSGAIIDAELNASLPALNENVTAENVLSVMDNYVEFGGNCEKEVKTLVGRIGGIPVSALVFDGGENGVELTEAKLAKINRLLSLAYDFNLPFVVFADVKGIAPCMQVNNSGVMRQAAEYLSGVEALNVMGIPKISVIYKKAIGLGYSLFGAKSVGFDYTCAFANASIGLFDGPQGAQIELNDEKADKAALAARYSTENTDPIHAAKNGYIDGIIDPQFVKQYLIASLQMLVK